MVNTSLSLRLVSLALSLCVHAGLIRAQIGVQAQYHLPALIGENDQPPVPVLQSAWSAGLVYTFRQSGIRWEWVPGIFYLQTTVSDNGERRQGTGAMVGLDTRVYPMDLYGDCLCPTFSRKGALFQKGFFWEGGAGAWFLDQDLGSTIDQAISFYVRAGMGLDIGLNRRFTLTPGLRLQYMHQHHTWGMTPSERQHRPVWLLPYLQWMTYLSR